jgi:hypothetical protein
MRVLALAFILPAVALHAADTPAITATPLAAPAHANAIGASVTSAPDGTLWLTWLEKNGAVTALRFATLAPAASAWSPAGTIASSADIFVSGSNFPTLTVGPQGRAVALWSVSNPVDPKAPPAAHSHHGAGYHAWVARTEDGGKTWTPGAPLTRESDVVEFASLTTLADGRVLAAWLDGREKKHGRKVQQLFARIVGEAGPDTLVDPSVCDCCHTSLSAFPDGSALLAYRGRTADEIRDIRVTRFQAGRWDESRAVHRDGWKIAGCPVNGPQLASDGGRVVSAWFTAANNEPRVLVALSPDAGDRFLSPLTLNSTKTAGRVATTLLHDGAMLATSVDTDGALWLRRINPDFNLTEPVRLTTPETGRIKGFPRLALRRDFSGGKTPAQLVVALVRETDSALQTLLVNIPEGDLLEAERNCDCSTAEDELLGFSIRGIVTAAPAGGRAVRVQHAVLPGMFAAGEREFALADSVRLDADAAGHPFVGRVRRHENGWQLFSVRLLPRVP